jgi:hypothetical protein
MEGTDGGIVADSDRLLDLRGRHAHTARLFHQTTHKEAEMTQRKPVDCTGPDTSGPR